MIFFSDELPHEYMKEPFLMDAHQDPIGLILDNWLTDQDISLH